MKIRVCSDLHLESGIEFRSPTNGVPASYIIPKDDADSESVLIIAGDIHYITKMHTVPKFFEDLSNRFKAVIVVTGNHEYWKGNMTEADAQYRAFLKTWENIHFLQGQHITIDGVTFYGCTLWTELKAQHDLYFAQYGMVDYRAIRFGGQMLHARDTRAIHTVHRDGLEQFIKHKHDKANKLVVVTHHGPSFKSCDARFKDSSLNAAFYSDMDSFIADSPIDIWVHGHTHSSHDYHIGNTRIICNPMGYDLGKENIAYKSKLFVEI